MLPQLCSPEAEIPSRCEKDLLSGSGYTLKINKALKSFLICCVYQNAYQWQSDVETQRLFLPSLEWSNFDAWMFFVFFCKISHK